VLGNGKDYAQAKTIAEIHRLKCTYEINAGSACTFDLLDPNEKKGLSNSTKVNTRDQLVNSSLVSCLANFGLTLMGGNDRFNHSGSFSFAAACPCEKHLPDPRKEKGVENSPHLKTRNKTRDLLARALGISRETVYQYLNKTAAL
jgi:hypothetical protein